MSNRLINEVRDHAPRDLSAAEVLLLTWLADASSDEDRVLPGGRRLPARCCFPGIETLAEWMRMGPDGVRKVLRKLEGRGLQVRVPVGVDKAGRPLYAAKGHVTVYRVPEFAPAGAVDNSTKDQPTVPPMDSKDQPTVPPMDSKGQPVGSQRPASWLAKAGQLAGPNPNKPKTTLPPTPQAPEPAAPTSAGTATGRGGDLLDELTKELLGRHPATVPDDAREIVRRCLDDPETKAPASRLRQSTYVANLHSAVKADRAAARRAAFAAGAKCEDHSTEVAANCRSCAADIKGGDRDRRFLGKHQPECPDCWAPLIGQPEGSRYCKKHALDHEEAAA